MDRTACADDPRRGRRAPAPCGSLLRRGARGNDAVPPRPGSGGEARGRAPRRAPARASPPRGVRSGPGGHRGGSRGDRHAAIRPPIRQRRQGSDLRRHARPGRSLARHLDDRPDGGRSSRRDLPGDGAGPPRRLAGGRCRRRGDPSWRCEGARLHGIAPGALPLRVGAATTGGGEQVRRAAHPRAADARRPRASCGIVAAGRRRGRCGAGRGRARRRACRGGDLADRRRAPRGPRLHTADGQGVAAAVRLLATGRHRAWGDAGHRRVRADGAVADGAARGRRRSAPRARVGDRHPPPGRGPSCRHRSGRRGGDDGGPAPRRIPRHDGAGDDHCSRPAAGARGGGGKAGGVGRRVAAAGVADRGRVGRRRDRGRLRSWAGAGRHQCRVVPAGGGGEDRRLADRGRHGAGGRTGAGVV